MEFMRRALWCTVGLFLTIVSVYLLFVKLLVSHRYPEEYFFETGTGRLLDTSCLRW